MVTRVVTNDYRAYSTERGKKMSKLHLDSPLFIALEGPDGTGKSSVAHALVQSLTFLFTNEVHCYPNPGGTPLGAQIRKMVKDATNGLDPETVFYLFAAAHADLAHHIKKQLDNKVIVVVDRWWPSTFAYQGLCGIPPHVILDMVDMMMPLANPDCMFYLRASNETAIARMSARDAEFKRGRFEEKGLAFRSKLLDAYDGMYGAARMTRIDTDNLTLAQVTDAVMKELIRAKTI